MQFPKSPSIFEFVGRFWAHAYGRSTGQRVRKGAVLNVVLLVARVGQGMEQVHNQYPITVCDKICQPPRIEFCERLITGDLRFYDLISNRVAHNLTDGMEFHLLHDICSMGFGGLGADIKC